jgi:pyruvate/2-oxoglutarate dehydrogenase complex dihydrolipoamide acyltransferase (E2) component
MAAMLRALLVMSIVFCVACVGKKDKDADKTAASPPVKPAPAPASAPPPAAPAPPPSSPAAPAKSALAENPSSAPGPTTPEVADAPAGNPPPDGKYERVMVDGVTVPMVNITNGGTVVLVDTDGKKPRTWEEQYKKKNAKLPGQLDIHKTDTNKNGSFDDDAIDREGIWTIDAKGNITKH